MQVVSNSCAVPPQVILGEDGPPVEEEVPPTDQENSAQVSRVELEDITKRGNMIWSNLCDIFFCIVFVQ